MKFNDVLKKNEINKSIVWFNEPSFDKMNIKNTKLWWRAYDYSFDVEVGIDNRIIGYRRKGLIYGSGYSVHFFLQKGLRKKKIYDSSSSLFNSLVGKKRTFLKMKGSYTVYASVHNYSTGAGKGNERANWFNWLKKWLWKLKETVNIGVCLLFLVSCILIGIVVGNVEPSEPMIWKELLFGINMGVGVDFLSILISFIGRKFGFGEEKTKALFVIVIVLGLMGLVVGWALGVSGVISSEVLESMVEEGDEANRSKDNGVDRKGKGPAA